MLTTLLLYCGAGTLVLLGSIVAICLALGGACLIVDLWRDLRNNYMKGK